MQTFFHLLKWQIRQHCVLLLMNFILLTCILLAPLYFSSNLFVDIGGVLRYVFILCFSVLLIKIVHSQPFAGSDSFWMTRPVGRRHLLLAQLTCLTLFVCLPSVLEVCWNTYQLDGDTTHYIGGLLRWGTYLGMGLFLFSIAATSSSCTGAIIMLVGVSLVSVLSVTAVQYSATARSTPNPDTWIIIMPAIGIFATMAVVLFIKHLGRAIIALVCLVLLIPLALNALRSFSLGMSPEQLLATAPKVELRMNPSPNIAPGHTSYMHPLQITAYSNKRFMEPSDVRLQVNDDLYLSANFSKMGGQMSPYLIDKIIAAFPEADQIVSTQNPRAFINAPFLKSTWNQFSNRKSKPVSEVVLDEGITVRVRLSSFALYHLGPMSVVDGAQSSREGHRITINTVLRRQQDVLLKYSYLRHITTAMNWRMHQDSSRNTYVVLYDRKSRQVTINSERIHLTTNQAFSLATTGGNNGIRLPLDLLNEDVELHLFIAELEGEYQTTGEAEPGTYYSARSQALK